MDIGAGLKRQRLARGATLKQIADLCGTDAGNLSRVERNIQDVSFQRLSRICAAMELRVVDFLSQVEHWENATTLPPSALTKRLRAMMRLFGAVSRRDQMLLLALARGMARAGNDEDPPRGRRRGPPLA
ncbi:MAG: helix-turn-helix domain-containing protein [Alcanivorax sp.]|nr:helix-turn-helix domain-containing protein [Alcanivorax sp.]